MNELVSIVVPIHNKEKYLSDLLESLSRQSHSKCEFIMIDDCSSDNSVKIVNSFIKKDYRFRLYKNLTNKGVSYSRNLGLFKARGEYISFIDADDLLDSHYVEKLLSKFDGGGVSISMCSTIMILDNSFKKMTPVFKKTGKYTGLQYWERFDFVQSSANWNKMYCKKFLLQNNSWFEEIKGPEDLLFNFSSIPINSVIAYIDEPLYYYRATENSLSKSFSGVEYQKEIDCRFYLLDLLFEKSEYSYIYRQLTKTCKFIAKHKLKIEDKKYVNQRKSMLKRYFAVLPLSFKERVRSYYLLSRI